MEKMWSLMKEQGETDEVTMEHIWSIFIFHFRLDSARNKLN